MNTREAVKTITLTAPSTAGTVVHTEVFKGSMLHRADRLVIDALIRGGTGGTLDVYLQRKLGADSWTDLVHWPQQTAGASAKRYTCNINGDSSTIQETGNGTDATPNVTLAANTIVNVVPGDDIRIVLVAGAGTTAGQTQTITITPYTDRH